MAAEPQARRNSSGASLSAFHSRYDPRKEAERHIDAVLAGKRPSIVFIIGGGLNYIGAVIADRFPKALRVSLQPCDDFEGSEVDDPPIRWQPSSQASLGEILWKAVSGNRLGGGVAILEWPPVVSRFPSEVENIRTTLRNVLDAASSDSATSGYWASRWLRNCIHFAMTATRSVTLVPGTGTVVIACAGPSLDDALPDLLRIRPDIALWSLASAIPALLHHGIVPDLALSTDPGYWNGAHLRSPFMHDIPLAIPPSSFVPRSIIEGSAILAIDTGLSFERLAISTAGLAAERASSSGSAAGTALSLALRLTSGQVVLAGYDLAARGIKDHATPYAFDVLDELSASRLRPAFAARSERIYNHYPAEELGWRRSRPFSTYAATIRPPETDSGRVSRLGSSPVETPLPRGRLGDLDHRKGTPPACIRETSVRVANTAERAETIPAMLASLADSALDEALAALSSGEPLPYDATVFYKAVAPRESAALLAGAARGEATESDVRGVDRLARTACAVFCRDAPW